MMKRFRVYTENSALTVSAFTPHDACERAARQLHSRALAKRMWTDEEITNFRELYLAGGIISEIRAFTDNFDNPKWVGFSAMPWRQTGFPGDILRAKRLLAWVPENGPEPDEIDYEADNFFLRRGQER